MTCARASSWRSESDGSGDCILLRIGPPVHHARRHHKGNEPLLDQALGKVSTGRRLGMARKPKVKALAMMWETPLPGGLTKHDRPSYDP